MHPIVLQQARGRSSRTPEETKAHLLKRAPPARVPVFPTPPNGATILSHVGGANAETAGKAKSEAPTGGTDRVESTPTEPTSDAPTYATGDVSVPPPLPWGTVVHPGIGSRPLSERFDIARSLDHEYYPSTLKLAFGLRPGYERPPHLQPRGRSPERDEN